MQTAAIARSARLLVLLVGVLLATLVAASPASAQAGSCNAAYPRLGPEQVGNAGGDWGSIAFAPNSGPLALDVVDGYWVELCVFDADAGAHLTFGQGRRGDGLWQGPVTASLEHPGDAAGFDSYAFRVLPNSHADVEITLECAPDDGAALADIHIVNSDSVVDITFSISLDGVEQSVTLAPGEEFLVEDARADEVVVTWYDADLERDKVRSASVEDLDCTPPPPPPAEPAATIDVTCDNDPTILLDNTDGSAALTFTIEGAPGLDTVEVPAGETQTVTFELDEDAAYDITVTAEGMEPVTASGTRDCQQPQPEEVTPAEPTFVEPTCDDDADVTLPTVEGVTYEVTGTIAPGETVTVTATPTDASYVFPDGAPTEWTHTFAPAPTDCDGGGDGDGGDGDGDGAGTPPDDDTGVQPGVAPSPQPQPQVQPQAQPRVQPQLAATGFDSGPLLVLALLMLGLGATAVFGAPRLRREG